MKRLVTILLFAVTLFTAYTAMAQAPVATPKEAITGLLNRIGGEGAADKFVTVIDASLAENDKDVFIITAQDGKPCIKGNTQLSVATGINWYLNHYAHINLTWNNLTTDLVSVDLPIPTKEEKHVSSATYRYDFNTCTFSYSMAFWTWERWQKEIDWMALHGINAPLNLVGLDVVTRKFLTELGVSENDIDAYIAGPGFIAWFAMNNLEGWGSTIDSPLTGVQMNGNPDWWYTRQEQLCKKMLQRMRELGMQPVIPGFSGQVPNCIVKYTINGFSSDDVVNNGTWAGGYTRPDILKPNTQSYRTFADVYYKHLHDVMGVSELYSMDPFHEGSLPGGVTNETCYPNIMVELDKYHDAVSAEDKTTYRVATQPKWIIQYWQNVPQSGAFSAMSSYGDRFIGLDLFSDNIYADNAAKWREGNLKNCYYQGRPYIYCMLHNFGGRSGLHGRLETTMDGYFQALANNNNCQGIGATPEGTETNPILYDMLFELPWMDKNPGADAWLAEYAYSRYGINPAEKDNANVLEALKNLKKSVWDCKVNQQGTSEAVILARPNWTIGSVSSWSTAAIYWDTQDVLLAADQLYSVKDLVTANGGQDGIANYNYDFIDVVRQAMVDYAAQLLPLINTARGNNAEYTRLYQLYLQLMLDLDTMLSYDENFKLERWTSLARNIADEVNGTTENDRNWLEWNARTQVTVWSKGNTDLHDYSNRCWAGLIKDFHYKRWEKFFTTNGGSFDGGWFSGFEYPWTVDFNETYDLAGDYSKVVIPTDMTATEKAAETFGKYFGRVKGAAKNYVFPMGVATNATKSDVIPEVYRGKEVELPLIIGKDVTITSVWIDLNADGAEGNGETLTANGNNVEIPADAAIGKTKATVTFNDGTEITFNLALVEDITENRTVTAATADANMGTVAIEGTNELTITNKEAVKITATANSGYNFNNWTDAQGNVVSNDNPFMYYGKENANFTANFIQDKWGVVACNGTFSGDIAGYAQFIHNLTFAYYNREAETILEVTDTPTQIFNTIPQIINVPQGASFTVKYDNGDKDGLKYCYFRAFIDLNADGDFDDEGELIKEVGTNGAQNPAVCSNTMNVLLPYDMPLGITHMRLRFDGAWDNSNNPSGRGAKDASIRPVYEILLNITDKSDKAAHVVVKSNNNDWGTAEVWTDETPDGSTGSEWDISSNIPMYLRATKASEDVEFLGWYDQYDRLLTTELKYTMYAREDATYTAKFRKFLEIDGWQIEYRTEGSDIILTKVHNSGNADLVIPETINILGVSRNIIGFDNGLFNNNKELTSITLPKNIKFLSIEEFLNGSMKGSITPGEGRENQEDYTIYNLSETIIAATGFEVTVTGISNGSTYNQWGSGLFATGTNPLAVGYTNGFQFYLKANGSFVLKIDSSGDSGTYTLNNSNCKVIANTEFTATIKYNNGCISVTVDNGMGEIGTYTKNCTINNISTFSAAIPQGIDLNVSVKKLQEKNPFEGCTNIDRFEIDADCEKYHVEESDGGIYNSDNILVALPEGKEKGADRRTLGALIEKMKVLTDAVATYNPTGKQTEIVLTTTQGQPNYIWSNAPQANDPVGNLLDNNQNTIFHSNWESTTAPADGLDHHLTIELGEDNAISKFKFYYDSRNSGGYGDYPTTIKVQGSNDGSNYTDIKTINPVNENGNNIKDGADWTSELLGDGNTYTYLRFMVTATTTNNKKDGHIYWHMAEFDLYKVSASADVYTHLEGGITDEQAAVAYDAMIKAIKVYDNGTTAAEMQKANSELQTAYEELLTLVNSVLPFKLTLDEENPVLYNIVIKRADDGSKVLSYDAAADEKIKIVDKANNNSWLAWFFKGSEEGITIHPYNGDGKVLSVANTTDARESAYIAKDGDAENQHWSIKKSTAEGCTDYYYIKISGTNNATLSHNGGFGVTSYMGIWSGGWNSNDGGSLFKFIDAEFENDNPRYYQLKDLKATMPDGTNIYDGTSVGLYTGGKEYREAYTAAAELETAGNTGDSKECHAAYKALRTTKKNLSYNAADPNKFYVIKSTSSNDYCKGKYVHTNRTDVSVTNWAWGTRTYNQEHLKFENYIDIAPAPLAIFQFEETNTTNEYKINNLHTGLYIKSFNGSHMGEANSAAIIKIAGITDGQVALYVKNDQADENRIYMHAQEDFSVIVKWSAEANNASTWTIDEVTDLAQICHNVTIGEAGYSTLYLNYPVAIPDGITAYTAKSFVDDQWLSMENISGTIPARTAVILKGEPGTYPFVYAKDTQTTAENVFKGTLWEKEIERNESDQYYILAKQDPTPDDGIDNKVVGFFRPKSDEDFISSANKAYLHIPAEDPASLSAFFGFRFGDDTTTEIEEVFGENENRRTIYDLTGRRLENPTKGIYIINGKKVFIK